MMKRFLTRVVVLLGLAVLSPAASFALVPTVSLLGGLNQTVSATGNSGYTLGADLALPMGIMTQLTVGGMYLSRHFDGGYTAGYIKIPAVLRFGLGSMANLGVGGFYEASMDSLNSSNYGVRGSLRVKFVPTSFFVEANYDYRLNSPAGGFKDVQALIGWSLL